jgi:hypothetical protein
MSAHARMSPFFCGLLTPALIHQKVTTRKETYIQTFTMLKISKSKQTIKHLSKVYYQRLLERFQRDDDSSGTSMKH